MRRNDCHALSGQGEMCKCVLSKARVHTAVLLRPCHPGVFVLPLEEPCPGSQITTLIMEFKFSLFVHELCTWTVHKQGAWCCGFVQQNPSSFMLWFRWCSLNKQSSNVLRFILTVIPFIKHFTEGFTVRILRSSEMKILLLQKQLKCYPAAPSQPQAHLSFSLLRRLNRGQECLPARDRWLLRARLELFWVGAQLLVLSWSVSQTQLSRHFRSAKENITVHTAILTGFLEFMQTGERVGHTGCLSCCAKLWNFWSGRKRSKIHT